MAIGTRFVLPIALSTLALLAGCGGGNNTAKPTPPPTGGFSVANLKGTYVFSMTGSDLTGNFIAMTGVFTATGTAGNSGISGGIVDINNSGSGFTSNPITSGNYTVTADGRGQATLATTTPFGSAMQVDFVLTSNSGGFITEFDGHGSASGSLELQTAATQPAAGTYVFGLSGIGTSATSLVPAGAAGAITIDGSGAATGSYDYNNDGTPALIAINSGSNLSAGSTPGTATLVTGSGTLNFDVYSIDGTHMKLIERDSSTSSPILAGDLFAQTSAAFPSGQIVFTMAGFDGSIGRALTVGGLMTSDGSSAISNGEEDFNDGGSSDSTPLAFSGTISASGGRYVLTMNNFENGANGAAGTFSFAAYPSAGGIELVEIDADGVTSGVAFSQTGTAIAAGQGYGMNLTGSNSSSEEDDIAEFTTTSTGLSGILDVNDQGQTNFGQKLTALYSSDSSGNGRGVITKNNFFNGVYYSVDGSTALFLETDQGQVGLGSIQTQSASASSNLAASHLAMLRLQPIVKNALRKHR